MWSQKISRFLIAVKRELFQQKLVYYVLLLLRLLSGADHGRKTTKIYDSCITDKPHFLKDELNVVNNSSNIPVIIISNTVDATYLIVESTMHYTIVSLFHF